MPQLLLTKLRLTVFSTPQMDFDLGNYLIPGNAYKPKMEMLHKLAEANGLMDDNSSPEARKGEADFPNLLLPDFPFTGRFRFILTHQTTTFDDPNTRFFCASLTHYS